MGLLSSIFNNNHTLSADVPYSRWQAQRVPDPAPKWIWTFLPMGVADLPKINPIYVSSVMLPFRVIQTENLNWSDGRRINIPRAPYSYEKLRLEFYDDMEYLSRTYLEAWIQRVQSNYNVVSLPANYMGKGFLVAFDTAGIPRYKVILQGLWPTSFGALHYQTHSNGGEPYYTATFNFNYMYTESLTLQDKYI